MPKVSCIVSHTLGKAEALKRVKAAPEEFRNEFGAAISNFQEAWNGDSGTFSWEAQGFQISGTIRVNDHTVVAECSLPWALLFFQNAIARMARERLEKLLV